MSFYHQGDRVVVRGDLTAHHRYPVMSNNGTVIISKDMDATPDMAEYRGQEVTIDRPLANGFYHIIEDHNQWFWSDGMFSGSADARPLEDDPAAWDSFFSDFMRDKR